MSDDTVYMNPKAMLMLFAYRGLTEDTHACLVRDTLSWPRLVYGDVRSDALISRSRSIAASRFLDKSSDEAGDVLLMVDHDVQWLEGDLSYIARKALEHNAVIGGVYPKRGFGLQWPVQFLPESGKYVEELGVEPKFGDDVLIPARYVSAGFMAIPREVLQAVSDPLPHITEGDYTPTFLPIVKDDEYLSEDWAFCQRILDAGYSVMVAVKPRLTHQGDYTFRMVDSKIKPRPDEAVALT